MSEESNGNAWNYQQVVDYLKRSKRSVQTYIKSGDIPETAISTDAATGERLFDADAIKKLAREKGWGNFGVQTKGAGSTNQALGAQKMLTEVTAGLAGQFRQELTELRHENTELHQEIGKYKERSQTLTEVNSELKQNLTSTEAQRDTMRDMLTKALTIKTRWQTSVMTFVVVILMAGIVLIVLSFTTQAQ